MQPVRAEAAVRERRPLTGSAIETPAVLGPRVAERSRYLDVLRGVALLGILPANIPWFGLPATAGEPGYLTGGAVREHVAFYATRVLVDYKFITLFSLLFGVGLALLRRHADEAAAAGAPRKRIAGRRLVVLWIFGILHGTLLWYGDIVSYYAPIGLLVFWTTRWEARRLARVGAAIALVPVAAMLFLAPLVHFDPDSGLARALDALSRPAGSRLSPEAARAAATGSTAEFRAALRDFSPELETAVYREGSFRRITVVRTITWIFGIIFGAPLLVWRIAGLFLIGMALAKSSWFLDPGANRAPFDRMLEVGLATGLPLTVAGAVAHAAASDRLAVAVLAELFHYAGAFGLSAAYAAIVARLLARAGGAPSLLARFEAVGRTAFSSYLLLQSGICTFIFYSYGLALFGRLDRAALLLVVALVWTVQLLASPLWLRRFRFGPVEWLWRSLTYGRLQPLRVRASPP